MARGQIATGSTSGAQGSGKVAHLSKFARPRALACAPGSPEQHPHQLGSATASSPTAGLTGPWLRQQQRPQRARVCSKRPLGRCSLCGAEGAVCRQDPPWAELVNPLAHLPGQTEPQPHSRPPAQYCGDSRVPRVVPAFGELVARVTGWRVICRGGWEPSGTSSLDIPGRERAEDYGWRGG